MATVGVSLAVATQKELAEGIGVQLHELSKMLFIMLSFNICYIPGRIEWLM